MSNQQQFEFVRILGKDLEAGDIRLPSLPAVLLKIRNLLEEDDNDFEKVSKIVSVDTALVSKLFVFANSAFHNRGGETIVNLDAAIAKLGLDLVRSTAVALVIKQLVRAQEQSDIMQYVRSIWSRSMRLSSMSYALAAQHSFLNNETAFMCGLLHDVGKLYVLSKAKDVPGLLTSKESFRHVLEDWNPQIGRCIVDAWEFPAEVVESIDPDEFLDEHVQRAPRMVDVVYVACMLIDGQDGEIATILASPAGQKLHISKESIPGIFSIYKDKLAAVQQSFS